MLTSAVRRRLNTDCHVYVTIRLVLLLQAVHVRQMVAARHVHVHKVVVPIMWLVGAPDGHVSVAILRCLARQAAGARQAFAAVVL